MEKELQKKKRPKIPVGSSGGVATKRGIAAGEGGYAAGRDINQIIVNLPEKEATEKEIVSPESEKIAGPDGSYIIDEPPKEWVVGELTISEWINEGLRITDPSINENLFGAYSQAREIISIKSKRELSIIPIPGKTLIDGRKSLTALEIAILTRLSIIPIDRAQPPLYIERSLEHNLLTFVGQILNGGVVTLDGLIQGTIPKIQRRYMIARFRQKVEDAIINGEEGKNVIVNIAVIGMEGELRDHLLIMNYPTFSEDENPKLDQDFLILQSLVSSFRPLKVVNPDEKRMEIKNIADQNFKQFMVENGETVFFTEFGFLIARLKGWDMNAPKKWVEAINLLKPFEVFAKEINLQDEDLDKLWESLNKAEEGDVASFKIQINHIIDIISNQMEPDQKDPILVTSGNEKIENDLI